jgi:hypothetical protein
VHGDDYVTVGKRSDVEWFKGELEHKFEIKTSIAGRDKDLEDEVRVLNRIIRRTRSGWELEGDQRHGEIVVRDTGMRSAKGVSTPWAEIKEESDEKVPEEEVKWYRGLAARCNYMTNDRPDMCYASKEMSRKMSSPGIVDVAKLRRVGKYLKSAPRVVQLFAWQNSGAELRVYTDSDWAGCKATRKSTSGGAVVSGRHCLKFWSKTQQSITLSSAEAELVAMVKGSCEAIGVGRLMTDLGGGKEQVIGVYTDASAAIGIAQRQGVGRTRHIDVGNLWIQQKQRQGDLMIEKVAGANNPADMFTKAVPYETMDRHMTYLGFKFTEGKAAKAVGLVD